MAVLDEVLSANEQYAASFGEKSELALPPARQFAILTCMDALLDPAKYAGLSEGDAHVIRTGGRAFDDAIRSLVISAAARTQEWFVIHHTNCGMGSSPTRGADLLAQSPRQRSSARTAPTSAVALARAGQYIGSRLRRQRERGRDVSRIRAHPLVPARIPIYGYVYDVTTGAWSKSPRRLGRPCGVNHEHSTRSAP